MFTRHHSSSDGRKGVRGRFKRDPGSTRSLLNVLSPRGLTSLESVLCLGDGRPFPTPTVDLPTFTDPPGAPVGKPPTPPLSQTLTVTPTRGESVRLVENDRTRSSRPLHPSKDPTRDKQIRVNSLWFTEQVLVYRFFRTTTLGRSHRGLGPRRTGTNRCVFGGGTWGLETSRRVSQ